LELSNALLGHEIAVATGIVRPKVLLLAQYEAEETSSNSSRLEFLVRLLEVLVVPIKRSMHVDEVVAWLPWSTLPSIFLSMCVRYNVGEKDQDNNLANNDPMESDDDDDDDDDSTTTWFLTDCERFYFNK
jgi:hypothetical protein